MGYVEFIKPDGTKVTVANDEIIVDVVNLKDCCELCNDPRMVHEGELVKCHHTLCSYIRRLAFTFATHNQYG